MDDKSDINKVIHICTCRILSYYNNDTCKELINLYEEVKDNFVRIKSFNNKDSYYKRVQELMGYIYCRYLDGDFKEIEEYIPNLGKVISSDRELFKGNHYHYACSSPNGTVNYRTAENRIKVLNGKEYYFNEESTDVFNNNVYPIIKRISEMDKDNNYTNNGLGYKEYNFNYNGKVIYVYTGYGSLIISLEKLVWDIVFVDKERYDYLGGSKGTYRDILLTNKKYICNDKNKYIIINSDNRFSYSNGYIDVITSNGNISEFFNNLNNNKHM